jgi:RNA polymerase sigma factor (TIGR02999 family)
MRRESTQVTRLMERAGAGDETAADQLLPLVYDELRRAAARLMAAERPDHTLQATALVHEAYIRLVGDRRVPWANRAHFYSAAAEAMRRILIDHGKARGRIKRGRGLERVPLSIADVAASWDLEEILSLDEALRRLTDRDRDIGEVFRLRFLAGLSIQETADALEVSTATVKRRWEFGRTWLFRELRRGER